MAKKLSLGIAHDPMEPGEIRKLPKANSPLWTEQWAIQGTAKLPYIVSNHQGIGWACSCKNWTMIMPRQACKHILQVQLKEGIIKYAPAVKKTPAEVAGVPVGGLNLFADRGRKFRV